ARERCSVWPLVSRYACRRDRRFSLHDALPISVETLDGLMEIAGELIAVKNSFLTLYREARGLGDDERASAKEIGLTLEKVAERVDRKSTRLNSSHVKISYAVFCLKTKTRTERV